MLFHNSNIKYYSLLNHLASGGVDCAHLDFAKIESDELRMAKQKEMGLPSGSQSVLYINGKYTGMTDDVRAMTQTGYLQYKLEQVGV